LAIVVVLLLRWMVNSLGGGISQSHLITYCWTFLVAFVVGPAPAGLAVAVHSFAATGRVAGHALRGSLFQNTKVGLRTSARIVLSRKTDLLRFARYRRFCYDGQVAVFELLWLCRGNSLPASSTDCYL
jgi:hypothetical protein